LIRIKDCILSFGTLRRNQKEIAMPVDSLLVCAAVVAVFAIFSAVLIWGDFQSGSMSRQPISRTQKRRSF
jgi:hypothetical protein